MRGFSDGCNPLEVKGEAHPELPHVVVVMLFQSKNAAKCIV